MHIVGLVIKIGVCMCQPRILPTVAKGKGATQPVNTDEAIKHVAAAPLGILEESVQPK